MNFVLILLTSLITFAYGSSFTGQVASSHDQLSARFSYFRLSDVADHSDLAIFDQLLHIKDREYFFKCLLFYFFDREVFTVNGDKILNSIFWKLREYPRIVSVEDQIKIFNGLVKLQDFDRVIEFLVMYPRALASSTQLMKKDMSNVTRFVQHIMNLDEKLYRKIRLSDNALPPYDKERANKNLYSYFLAKLSKNTVPYFLLSSILAKVPHSLYLDLIETRHKQNIDMFLEVMLTEIEIFGNRADMISIYQKICSLIRTNKGSTYMYLLNEIRFGVHEPLENGKSISELIETMCLTDQMKIQMLKAAALAENNQVVVDLFRKFRHLGEILSIPVLICLIKAAPDINFDSIASVDDIVLFLADKYDISNLKRGHSESSILLSFVLKSGNDENGLPVTFDYLAKYENIDIFRVISRQFFQQECSTESMLTFLQSLLALNNEPEFYYESLTGVAAFKVSHQNLRIISESEEILRIVQLLGMNFLLDPVNGAKLFDRPVKNLDGILKQDNIRHYFSTFTSFEQIRNFEELFELSVPVHFDRLFGLYRRDIIMEDSNPEFNFMYYRVIFHYWLQGPHRDLFKYLTNNFMELWEQFAKEVSDVDKNLIESVNLDY